MIIKTTVSKTYQEVQFEPIMISVSIEKEICDSDYAKEIKRLSYDARKEVKRSMTNWLDDDDE